MPTSGYGGRPNSGGGFALPGNRGARNAGAFNDVPVDGGTPNGSAANGGAVNETTTPSTPGAPGSPATPGAPGRLSERPPTGYRPSYEDDDAYPNSYRREREYGDEDLGDWGGPGGGGPDGPDGPQHGRQPSGGKGFIDYPRWGKTGWRRWIPSWKLVAGLSGFAFLLVILLFMWAYASTDIPNEDTAVKAQTTVVYYSDGKTEIGRLSEQNRVPVKLDKVSPNLQNAVIAAEDHTFRTNSGVDPKSLARAAWSNVRGNSTQGGSTITQQYVKNVYDLRDRSVKRKAKEFFIALKIDRTEDKNQILERYLNTIYMGRGAYGIEAATQAYFGKNRHASDLNVSESAFLAGLINAPSRADPFDGGADRAQFRWRVVLDQMVKDGDLSQADRAKQVFPANIKENAPSSSWKGQKGYMLQLAVDQTATKLGVPKDEVETKGYNIVTTFNKSLVIDADRAMKEKLGSVKSRPKNIQAGLVSIDPKSGAVRALYGGPDYVTHGFNNAFQGKPQAGSTFKPFGLIAALEDGVSLKSRFSGASPMKFPGAKKPVKNFGNENYGVLDLSDATAHSVNTIFVALNKAVGPEKTQKAAYDAGIPKSANVQDNLVNVLGTANPTVVDMANAYATFADGGVRHNWYVVESVGAVEDNSLDNTWTRKSIKSEVGEQKVFSSKAVADLTYAMQQVVKRGSGSYARQLNRPVAGKTGTSNDSMSAWFVGFTPQLVTAVSMWQNNADGDGQVPMKGFGGFSSITGGSFPVQIWTEYMGKALEGKDVIQFPDPNYGGEFMGTPTPKPIITTQAPQPTETETPDDPNPQPSFSVGLPTSPIFPTFGNGGGGNGNGNGNDTGQGNGGGGGNGDGTNP